MLRLRPYKNCDADIIASWIKNEYAFRQWCADRYDRYPISGADINAHYAGFADADWFYPMTAFDETGVVGHLIMRFTDEEKNGIERFRVVLFKKCDPDRHPELFLRAEKVTLGVFENNPAAYYCYKAAGFQDVPTEQAEYYHVLGEDWKCLEMERTL